MRVPRVFECLAKESGFSCIQVDSVCLRLCVGSHHVLEDLGEGADRGAEGGTLIVAEEVAAPGATAGFGGYKACSVTVNPQHHGTGMVHDGGVGVAHTAVKEVICGILCAGGLANGLGCNVAECVEHGGIDGASAAEELISDLLNELDVLWCEGLGASL